MSVTISDGVTSFSPLLVLGWNDSSEARNIEHNIIGRPDLSFSLQDDSLPAGELQLLFDDRAEVLDARETLRSGGVFTHVDTERPELNISFCRIGQMRLDQDETRQFWTITVGYQQVLP
jgi:hypothetical protein